MKLLLIVLLVIVVTLEVFSNPVDDGIRIMSRQESRASTDATLTESDSTKAPYGTDEGLFMVPSQQKGKEVHQHTKNGDLRKCCQNSSQVDYTHRYFLHLLTPLRPVPKEFLEELKKCEDDKIIETRLNATTENVTSVKKRQIEGEGSTTTLKNRELLQEPRDRVKRSDEAPVTTPDQLKQHLGRTESREKADLELSEPGVLNKRQLDEFLPAIQFAINIHHHAPEANHLRAVSQELTPLAISTSIPDPHNPPTVKEGQRHIRAADITTDGNAIQGLSTPEEHCNHHGKSEMPRNNRQTPLEIVRVANTVQDANVDGALSVMIEQIRQESGSPARRASDSAYNVPEEAYLQHSAPSSSVKMKGPLTMSFFTF